MRRLWAAPVVLLSVLLGTGCDSGDDYDTVDERFLPVFTDDFWTWYPFFAGNGDLQIYGGSTDASDDDDDGLIFEFGNGSIIGRTSPSSGTPDDDDVGFGEFAHKVDNEIFDVHGNLLCWADFGAQPGTFQLHDADGEVLFTSFANLIFEGDVTLPKTGHEFAALMDDHLLYSYKHDRIHAGWWPEGEILATATANIQLANPMRHLVLAAVIDGQCGSLGLD
jgi:hypothetical protein